MIAQSRNFEGFGWFALDDLQQHIHLVSKKAVSIGHMFTSGGHLRRLELGLSQFVGLISCTLKFEYSLQ